MLRGLSDDGLHCPVIKPHSLEKIVRHDLYARVFATALKATWPQRAYVGLYSGAGRARLETTGEIIETTPLGALRIPDPFTKYIFVDRDEECTRALRTRIASLPDTHDVTLLMGDVNDLVPGIKAAMPRFSRNSGLISFCFVDPFDLNVKLRTIRALSVYRMDFLVLLMLGLDARTNFRRYLEDPTDRRIADLIDEPDWRAEWQRAQDKNVIRFLLRRFDEAMATMGYRPTTPDLMHHVRIPRKNVMIYTLVFYTRHELGEHLWRAALKSADPQLALGFD